MVSVPSPDPSGGILRRTVEGRGGRGGEGRGGKEGEGRGVREGQLISGCDL